MDKYWQDGVIGMGIKTADEPELTFHPLSSYSLWVTAGSQYGFGHNNT
jgi:hypothetical protein